FRLTGGKALLGSVAPSELYQARSLPVVGVGHVGTRLPELSKVSTSRAEIPLLGLDDPQPLVAEPEFRLYVHRGPNMIQRCTVVPLFVEGPAEISLGDVRFSIEHVVQGLFVELDRLVVAPLI